MARSKNNIATEGLSGRVDQLVFRQRFGETLVSKRPVFSGKVSAGQLLVRNLFRQAAAYAKSMMNDPELKQVYSAKAKRGQSAYNVAFADFYKAPKIGGLDASAYDGTVGSLLSVAVTDDVKVESVQVKIENRDGNLVEEGAAQPHGNGLYWTYTATAANDDPSGSLITITARDLPRHESVKQVNL